MKLTDVKIGNTFKVKGKPYMRVKDIGFPRVVPDGAITAVDLETFEVMILCKEGAEITSA